MYVKFAVLLTQYIVLGQCICQLYLFPPSSKGYHLVLTGHSLGAGVASLLAVLFKPKRPTLHCYAYSPPGCVIRYCSYKLTITYHANSAYHALLHGYTCRVISAHSTISSFTNPVFEANAITYLLHIWF